MPRIIKRLCRECKKPFLKPRILKYCGDECRRAVKRRKDREYKKMKRRVRTA